MAKKRKDKKEKEDKPSSLLFLAGLFIGLAWGAITNNWAAGALAGLALGFLASAIARLMGKK